MYGEKSTPLDGLKLQCSVLATALQKSKPMDPSAQISVFERAPWDAHFFLSPMVDFKLLDRESEIVFANLIDSIEKCMPCQEKQLRILLDVLPEEAMTRIRKRGRHGEDGLLSKRLGSNYLAAVRHEHFCSTWDACVDGNRPPFEVATKIIAIIENEIRLQGEEFAFSGNDLETPLIPLDLL